MDNSNTMDGRIPPTKRRKKQSNRRTKLRSKISKPTRTTTRTSKQRKNGARMGNRARLGPRNVYPNNKKTILKNRDRPKLTYFVLLGSVPKLHFMLFLGQVKTSLKGLFFLLFYYILKKYRYKKLLGANFLYKKYRKGGIICQELPEF